MRVVGLERNLSTPGAPPLCFLDFDGDLSDWLVHEGRGATADWACFHTQMVRLMLDGVSCGIVPRTIGGPYTVLVAEQLHAAGARLIVGITSAGRVAPTLPLPCVVVVDEAIRDEGTSFHYLAPSASVTCPTPIGRQLSQEMEALGWPVRRGAVWTTDAPYRETTAQLHRWADAGVLAVEMQAASLFAFAHARGAQVGMVALVSNAVDNSGAQFDTGGHEHGYRVLSAVARAARDFL